MGGRPPYAAALFLAGWAATHWDLIDGRLALAGIDPDDLRVRRILNIAYTLCVEGMGREDEERFRLMLSPTEIQEQARDIEAERRQQRNAQILGADIDWDAAARARAEGLAELERRRRSGEG